MNMGKAKLKLDSIPVCRTTYVYQAALICEDCAAEITRSLRGTVAVDDDILPQGPYPDGGGEADSPQFCDRGRNCVNAFQVDGSAKVGCPLSNPLTSESVTDLRARIINGLTSSSRFVRKMGRILHHVWSDYSSPSETLIRSSVHPDRLPKSLVKLLQDRQFRTRDTLDAVVLCDSENVYLLARGRNIVTFLRAPVDDDSEFKVLNEAQAPIAATEGYDPEKLLASAVGDMAWD
jgi:hypothetical protein